MCVQDDLVGVGGAMEVRNVLCVPVVSVAMGNLVLAVVTLVNKARNIGQTYC